VRHAFRGSRPDPRVPLTFDVNTSLDVSLHFLLTFAAPVRLICGPPPVATLLALVGLYGVLALSVNARTREIAVRKAVGAQRHQIVGLVLGQGSKLVAGGVDLMGSLRQE
jgi:predicted lysophospholipase L1 biosynthesis ABC-type transport system permease subunit